MKYNRFYQFFSVVLAITVLFSTLSVSVGKHYCGDHLVDMAIFAEAEDCVMDMGDTHIDVSHEGTIVTEKTCCTDVVDLFEGQDELTIETTKVFKIDQQIFILSFAAVFSGLNLFEFQKDHPLERYNPPLCTKDIQVVNQVFLI